MPSAEDLRDWIAWERENLGAQAGKYPVVADVEVTGLWEHETSEHFDRSKEEREQTQSLFAEELARDPTDVAARFVALHFYHSARVSAESEVQEDAADPDLWPAGYGEERLGVIRAQYRLELAPLIGLLKVEECPADWDFIEWEILNSCLVGDLDRILKLLTRAEDEKLNSHAHVQAFRGQYRFVAVLGETAELESQNWRPRLYKFPRVQDPEDLLMGLRLLLLGMVKRDSSPATVQSEVELLSDSAHELQKAVASIADIPLGYTAALARSYFGVRKFGDAAQQYNHLLHGKLKIGDKLDLLKPVYESLVVSHERAGDAAGARAALAREIREYPNDKGLWIRMAELEAKDAHYTEAAECIRKEMELGPDVDKDWRLSLVLAVVETQGSLRELRRTVPQLCTGIQWGLERFWPTFRKLNPRAADACIEAEVDAALSQDKELFPEKFAKDAASNWAAAVEVELREELFYPFREILGMRGLAEQSSRSGSKSVMLGKFLLNQGPLSFGQMVYVLRECLSSTSGDALFKKMREWLGREYPSLDIEAVRCLEKIVDFRNPRIHREADKGSPEETMRLCRSMLEQITSVDRTH